MMANFRVKAIAFNSESLMPDQATMLSIAKRSSKVFCLYDNDATGMACSTKLCLTYPFVTRIPFETMAFGHKDVSDVVMAKDSRVMDLIRECLS